VSEIIFPNPKTHEFSEWVLVGEFYYNARDIIGFGGEMTLENLENAYRGGIFPWTIDGLPLPWFCPEKRAILEFSELHVQKSLRKARERSEFTYTIDKSFREVIIHCSEVKRSHESGTWITEEFIENYSKFHEFGMAHSVEVWERDELVGGLYGVDSGGVFCGESMFHHRTNASKFALLFLIDHMKSRGASWIDVQVMTPHFEVFGAKDIPRNEFLDKLKETQDRGLKLF
jgi:leucyl/phenylalanyl-tRNA---protein transferase